MGLTPKEAFAKAGKGDGVIGWALHPAQRTELLLQFPARYARAVANHVTLAARVRRDAALPGPAVGEIVGRTDDGAGVEALVVAIDGATDRPDGSHYHITWSLEPGRKARESNDAIAAFGWQPIALPVPVGLAPARWP